jgi:hypothetical protein
MVPRRVENLPWRLQRLSHRGPTKPSQQEHLLSVSFHNQNPKLAKVAWAACVPCHVDIAPFIRKKAAGAEQQKVSPKHYRQTPFRGEMSPPPPNATTNLCPKERIPKA